MNAGTFIGPYEILSLLGAGGMGEVYRARDPRIGREVAIKVLPKSLASDPERLQRFDQEARSAGLINHNNLLTIYELGSHDGAPYIVSELLEGETLRERLETGAIPPRKAVEYAIQIARGLSAAHEKGIVHRDLKPENLFITRDGRVKILDFGLAKLTGRDAAMASDAHTAQRNTAPGTVLGTVGYMSPEQIRGGSVDARSDLFSLGAVMFEILTGTHPFRRDTSAETMTAILREDPPEIAVSGSQFTPSIDRIVRHCLEKNPEERFQSARDLIFHLESVSGISAPQIIGVSTSAPGRTPWRLLSALGGALVIAALAFLAGRSSNVTPSSSAVPSMRFSQVTFISGAESFASISPDGKSIAFVSSQDGNEDIFVQRVDGQRAINLTRDHVGRDTHPSFSPDGGTIAFTSTRGGGGIFLMGATGESVRRLTDFGSSPSWSPDGRTIYFDTEAIFSPYVREGHSSIHSVDVATGRTTLLLKHDGVQPRVSPNGRRIAYWGLETGAGDRDIWTIPVAGDPEGANAVRVTDDPETDWNPFWSPDGRWLYFASDRGGSMNLWRVAIDEESGTTSGPPERMTLPAQWTGFFSAAADGTLAFVGLSGHSSVFQHFLNGEPSKRIMGGSVPIDFIDVSADQTAIVLTINTPHENIYVLPLDGSGMRQLTNDAAKDRGPVWSPDGSEIAFYSNRGGRYEIWSIRQDGSNLRQITRTSGGSASFPSWSPDGTTLASDQDGLKLFDGKTGEPGAAPELKGLPPGSKFQVRDWSGDGAFFAGDAFLGGNQVPGVFLVSRQTGLAERISHFGGAPKFLSGTEKVVIWEEGRLFSVDRSGGDPVPLAAATLANLPPVISFAVAADGRSLFAVHSQTEADVWLAVPEK